MNKLKKPLLISFLLSLLLIIENLPQVQELNCNSGYEYDYIIYGTLNLLGLIGTISLLVIGIIYLIQSSKTDDENDRKNKLKKGFTAIILFIFIIIALFFLSLTGSSC